MRSLHPIDQGFDLGALFLVGELLVVVLIGR
jgi:hypothetical protein